MASDFFAPSEGTKQLFRDYVKNASPLYTLAEQCYGDTLPDAFGLEFRSMLTHISRAEELFHSNANPDDKVSEKAQEELKKACRHLQRIKLDSLKLICDSLEEQSIERVEHMDKVCPLRHIEDGTFVKEILTEQSEARKSFEKAKNADCAGEGDVVGLYGEAAAQYVALAASVGLSCTGDFRPERAARFQVLAREERNTKIKGWVFLFIGLIVASVGFVLGLA